MHSFIWPAFTESLASLASAKYSAEGKEYKDRCMSVPVPSEPTLYGIHLFVHQIVQQLFVEHWLCLKLGYRD